MTRAAPDPPETVFDGEHLRVQLFAGWRKRPRLVVTFDWRREGRTGSGGDFMPARHATLFARQGHAQLTVRSRANDWFLNDETEALEAALAATVGTHGRRFPSVHLLGYSMGGYGALRFARALGADTAVLVAPQSGLAQPFEERWPEEAARFDPVRGTLPAHPGLRGLVLFDPFVAPDRLHAAAIAHGFPRLHMLRLPFAGHRAHSLLVEARAHWLVHREAAASAPRPGAIRAAHRAARAGSAGYWRRLAQAAGARHPTLAAAALARAHALDSPARCP